MALEIQSLHQGSAQSSSTQLRLVLCGAFWGWNPGGVKTGWGWWVHELGGQLMQEDHRLHILEQVIWRLWHWHPLQGFSFLGYQQSHLEDCARPAFCREAWKRWATGSPVGRWGLIGYCLLSYFSTLLLSITSTYTAIMMSFLFSGGQPAHDQSSHTCTCSGT